MKYDIDSHEMSKEELLDLQSWLSDARGRVFWAWVKERSAGSIDAIDGEPDTTIHPDFRRMRIERILAQHAKIREVLSFANRVADLLKP